MSGSETVVAPTPTRLVGATLLGLAVAVLVGVLVGALAGVLMRVGTGERDGWGDLAAFATALVVGAMVAVAVHLAAVIRLVVRFSPRGRRVGSLLWSAFAVLDAVVLAVVVRLVLGGDQREVVGTALLAGLGALVIAPPLVVAVRERR